MPSCPPVATRMPPGWRRAAALGLALGREAAGPAAGYAAVALLGVGALAACLPFGSLLLAGLVATSVVAAELKRVLKASRIHRGTLRGEAGNDR